MLLSLCHLLYFHAYLHFPSPVLGRVVKHLSIFFLLPKYTPLTSHSLPVLCLPYILLHLLTLLTSSPRSCLLKNHCLLFSLHSQTLFFPSLLCHSFSKIILPLFLFIFSLRFLFQHCLIMLRYSLFPLLSPVPSLGPKYFIFYHLFPPLHFLSYMYPLLVHFLLSYMLSYPLFPLHFPHSHFPHISFFIYSHRFSYIHMNLPPPPFCFVCHFQTLSYLFPSLAAFLLPYLFSYPLFPFHFPNVVLFIDSLHFYLLCPQLLINFYKGVRESLFAVSLLHALSSHA